MNAPGQTADSGLSEPRGTPPTLPPIIEMTDVAFGSMRDQDAVMAEGVNWAVRPGDFWVIGGLHGSGKSNLLHLAAGLMSPARGRYLFYGQPLPLYSEERVADRLRLGLVFDNAQLFNHLTVAENIALPLRYHQDLTSAQAQGRVQALLEETELRPWASSTPGNLGRNWQKRVGLARALALEPEVLLVDNPLGGLDPRHTWWWLQFLDRLSRSESRTPAPGPGDAPPATAPRQPVTLVVTTADFRPWKARARQFALLRDGRFQVFGDWSQVQAAAADLAPELAESRG